MSAEGIAIADETLVEAKRAIEAVLLVASDPTPEQLLAQLVELPSEVIAQLCQELADDYDAAQRGFELRKVAGGWRYQTHPDLHPFVERYALEGIPNRLSSAALETLAIVAYKQPISRAQISAIRGVNVDAVIRTLEQRGYIAEFGRDEGPGQAILFGTTSFFLERLGLASIEDLPSLGEFVPSAEVLEALEETLKIDSAEPARPVEDSGAGETEPSDTADPDVATDDAPEPGDATPNSGDGETSDVASIATADDSVEDESGADGENSADDDPES